MRCNTEHYTVLDTWSARTHGIVWSYSSECRFRVQFPIPNNSRMDDILPYIFYVCGEYPLLYEMVFFHLNANLNRDVGDANGWMANDVV